MPVLLLGTFCCRSVRQAVVPVLAATCCAVALSYCFILADNIELWHHPARHTAPWALMGIANSGVGAFQFWAILAMLGIHPTPGKTSNCPPEERQCSW